MRDMILCWVMSNDIQMPISIYLGDGDLRTCIGVCHFALGLGTTYYVGVYCTIVSFVSSVPFSIDHLGVVLS